MYICSNCGRVSNLHKRCNYCRHDKLFIGSSEFLEWYEGHQNQVSLTNRSKIRTFLSSIDFNKIAEIKNYQNELNELTASDIYD